MSDITTATGPHSAAPASTRAGSGASQKRVLGRVAIAAPILGAGVGAALAFGADRKYRPVGLGALAASLGLGLARWQFARWFTEQSPYELEFRDGELEVRRYAPSARAETVVEGLTWAEALNEGFQRIAAYILGQAQHGESERIAMAAPVTATVGTAPISTRTIAFTLPRNRRLSSLPTPKDTRVRLRYVPARRVAVLKFRGRYGGVLPAKKRDELLARVRLAGLHALGEVAFAGFDAPSTLPWLRRNEVQVDLAR